METRTPSGVSFGMMDGRRGIYWFQSTAQYLPDQMLKLATIVCFWQLATSRKTRKTLENWSRLSDSNRRPADYKGAGSWNKS
jgi:hypothetical protein